MKKVITITLVVLCLSSLLLACTPVDTPVDTTAASASTTVAPQSTTATPQQSTTATPQSTTAVKDTTAATTTAKPQTTTTPTTTAAAPTTTATPSSTDYIFNENFDNAADKRVDVVLGTGLNDYKADERKLADGVYGLPLPNSKATALGTGHYVEVIAGNGGKMLHIYTTDKKAGTSATALGNLYAVIEPDTTKLSSDSFVISFEFSTGATICGSRLLTLISSTSAVTDDHSMIYGLTFTAPATTASIYCVDGANADAKKDVATINIGDNIWHKLSTVIHLTSGTYDVYFDGAAVYTDVKISSDFYKTLSYFQLGFIKSHTSNASDGGSNGDMYFDNIQIYNAPVPSEITK